MKSIKLGQFLAIFSCLTILHSCGEGEFDSIKQAKNLRDDNGAKTGRWAEYIDEDGAIEDFYQRTPNHSRGLTQYLIRRNQRRIDYTIFPNGLSRATMLVCD